MANVMSQYDFTIKWDPRTSCYVATTNRFSSLVGEGAGPMEALADLLPSLGIIEHRMQLQKGFLLGLSQIGAVPGLEEVEE